MGYAIAEAAAEAGHRVTLVCGPVALPQPDHSRITTIAVETAEDMLAASRRAFARADAAIFAAAVCDYRPRLRARRKLPKARSGFTLDLESTADIAATLGAMKRRHQVTICFALQDYDGRRYAERKLLAKNCDAVVLNGPENVGRERALVEFLAQGKQWQRWPAGRKATIARRIVAWVNARIGPQASVGG